MMCARTIDSYPQKLARAARLSLVDMSCGGAVTSHLYHGGQLFQGPQVRVVGPATRLVTITVGGNDIGYIGDLSMLASRRSPGVYGWLVRHLWVGPKAWADRDFARLDRELGEVFGAIRRRSPAARIVVATYPTILPPAGTCALLSISAAEAQAMRRVGDRLAAVTAAAARRARAAVVDMYGLAAAHHACSAEPWVSGWTNGGIAPFHPTQAGTTATADAIRRAIAHQQL
nr:SGNH/GDSL hydrolase family protein [Sphingomonas rhizophila]